MVGGSKVSLSAANYKYYMPSCDPTKGFTSTSALQPKGPRQDKERNRNEIVLNAYVLRIFMDNELNFFQGYMQMYALSANFSGKIELMTGDPNNTDLINPFRFDTTYLYRKYCRFDYGMYVTL